MLDARGLACPIPVIRTQQAIQEASPESLEVLVDNRPAKENVTRFATRAGYSVSVTALEDGEFALLLTKNG
ncbi:MAG: sulfurtransferase TusA family protein [Oscillospiraceae bacterium]|jgi:TusA-related sulfurtransferase|nr:sulfurtransferase TusA family protein [Oscillospiraceae bacterium]